MTVTATARAEAIRCSEIRLNTSDGVRNLGSIIIVDGQHDRTTGVVNDRHDHFCDYWLSECAGWFFRLTPSADAGLKCRYEKKSSSHSCQNPHQTRARQLCVLLTAGLLLSACKPEPKVAEHSDPARVYALLSVNGNKVPANVSHDGTALQVRSGTFTIKADGTCSTKTVFVPPSGSEVVREVGASYTKEGSKLTLQWKGAGMTTGRIEGSTLTMDNEGMVFVYKK